MVKSILIDRERRYDIVASSVDGVLERWIAQYPDRNRRSRGGKTCGEIADGIAAAQTPDEAAAAIGNKSWTHPSCSCCWKDVQIAAVVGGDDDAKTVCVDCLQFLLDEAKRHGGAHLP